MHSSFARRNVLVSVPFAAVVLAGLALLSARAVGGQGIEGLQLNAARDGRVWIRSLPITIDRCGSYALRGCLTGASGAAGVTIDADDVTLDLAGFSLLGVPGSLAGVVVQSGRTNVRVKNGTVRNWGAAGVDAGDASVVRLAGLTAIGNGGAGLATGLEGVVIDCTASSNGGDGITVGFGGIVRSSTATGNGVNGIVAAFAATSTGCVIEGCTSRSNSFVGIFAGDGSTITGCSVTQNGTGGISVGPGCAVEGNAVLLNGEDGITAFDSLVRGNTSRGNFGAQINAPSSTVIENHL